MYLRFEVVWVALYEALYDVWMATRWANPLKIIQFMEISVKSFSVRHFYKFSSVKEWIKQWKIYCEKQANLGQKLPVLWTECECWSKLRCVKLCHSKKPFWNTTEPGGQWVENIVQFNLIKNTFHESTFCKIASLSLLVPHAMSKKHTHKPVMLGEETLRDFLYWLTKT